MKRRQFDLPMNVVISEYTVKAWHEIRQILVKALLHAARKVRHDAAGDLDALLLIRLKSVLNIARDFINLYITAQATHADAESLERYQAIFCHGIRLLK